MNSETCLETQHTPAALAPSTQPAAPTQQHQPGTKCLIQPYHSRLFTDLTY